MKTIIATLLGALFLNFAYAQGSSPTLKKLADSGEISIGVREQLVPFAYLDDNQKFVGYSIDICQAVVEELKKKSGLAKLKISYLPVSAATRVPLLANGTIDIECAATTNNAARQKQIAFSSTVFLTGSTFVSKKAKNIKSIDDLKGRAVTSNSGTTNLVGLNEANVARNLGLRIVPSKDITESFLLLTTDRVDAFVNDDVVLAALIASARDRDQYVISTEFFAPPEPYALAMRKDDPEFKKAVDEALKGFFASPAGVANYKKWFEHAIPPNGTALNFPMSPALAKAYRTPTDSIDPATYK